MSWWRVRAGPMPSAASARRARRR
ncbi:SPOR domain-containing protein [Cupriavidus sp. YAF13]